MFAQAKLRPETFGRLEAHQPHRQDAAATALSSLRATPETDNCGSALWLASFAKALSALPLVYYSFASPAKNIRSAKCRTSSAKSPIQQKSGRMRRRKILTNLRLLPVRPKLFLTKLVR
jgi:hypothetical protein